MGTKRAGLRSFFLLLFVAMVGMPAWAQNAGGRIVGTVFDQQGSVVPGAKVTVTNTLTSVSSSTTTDQEGFFQVLELPVGIYRVTVEHAGFRKTVTQNKKLEINQSLRFDITIALGATTQTVTVEAQVSGVETVSPTLGQEVTSRAVQDLPLNGRDVLALALLQPGVTEANPDYTGATTQGGFAFSIAGGRPDSITFLLDGGLNNNLLDNSNVLDPNPDAISEFRLLTSDYTAEYGRNGAGIISVVTKSGTNSIGPPRVAPNWCRLRSFLGSGFGCAMMRFTAPPTTTCAIRTLMQTIISTISSAEPLITTFSTELPSAAAGTCLSTAPGNPGRPD